MPNPGSYTFWNCVVVSWIYDAGKQELTVSATLNGKAIGNVVLTPTHKTAHLQGSDSGTTASVSLDVALSTRVIAMQADADNPTRSATGQGDF